MTIEQLDRYNDFVKFGVANKHPGLDEEPTKEEIAFFKSIGAWDDDEDDEDDREYYRELLEAPDED